MRFRFHVRFMAAAAAAIALGPDEAAAHGASHAAVAMLGADAQGATLVRLTHGLAYRTQDGFRFVCPESWGGDSAAPSSALPGGPAVVAAMQLHLIEPDGSISLHPNHEGAGIALARNRDALFGLFRRGDELELRRITRTTSELVRALEEPFTLLAATDSTLSLLRISERALTLQQLSVDGAPGERLSWEEPSKIASAELRSSGGDLYLTLVHSAAPWLTLGRIRNGSYEQLRSANSAFAGPVTLADDTLIVRDGRLERLEGDPLSAQAAYLDCLDALGKRVYACVGDGLSAIDAQGLAESLFDIATLRAPQYAGLSDTQRDDCSARWRDLRDHWALEGRIVAPSSDAREARAGDAPNAEPLARQPSSCALADASRSAGWLGALLFGLLLSRRRRRYSASES